MSNLKRSIFWLGVYLVAILVLAQFDYSGAPIINFAKYFYFLVMFAMPLTVFMPGVSKVNIAVLLFVWGCVYILVLELSDRSLSAAMQNDFPVILLEVILLEIGVWFSYQLAEGISHAESFMETMAISVFPNRTVSIDHAAPRINSEIMRSRRYHRPLSLLLVQLDPNDDVPTPEMIQVVKSDLWNHFSFARIGQIVDDHARQTDIVMRDHKNRFVILCPETDSKESEQLGQRINKAVEDKTGLNVIWTTVGFPDDALNFGDLLQSAQANLVKAASGKSKKLAAQVELKQEDAEEVR